jgi:hypothetical protein
MADSNSIPRTPNSIPGTPAEPRGFGEHTRGRSGEHAHEQGWGLNVEERSSLPQGRQNTDGGNDYEYGARDFGDEPVNTAAPGDPGVLEKARKVLRKQS